MGSSHRPGGNLIAATAHRMFELQTSEGEGKWAITFKGVPLLVHTPLSPCVYIGHGIPKIAFHCGNFDIQDFVEERVSLRCAALENRDGPDGTLRITLARHPFAEPELVLIIRVSPVGDDATIAFEIPSSAAMNRLWLRVRAQRSEHVWGAGEQLSYFDLRGRNFPLWTSESGVGRDKSTHMTHMADVHMAKGAGGNYHSTSYPQPTFVSSSKYCLHAETGGSYAEFDFRHPDFHELQFWAVPAQIELLAAPSFVELVGKISARMGRQPRLPPWVQAGAILGLKNGPEHAKEVLEKSRKHGVLVSALWCEDWVGIRQTTFGRRLFWDWKWNNIRYPQGREWVQDLKEQGIRFLGYTNPYLCSDGDLFVEAKELGFLALTHSGGEYLIDVGEFHVGIVDFTNPAAGEWFTDRIIVREMLEAGLDGWMADFGEYTPLDNIKFFNEGCPMLVHNTWPMLWAKVNADAIDRHSRTGDAIFFMRAGYTGSQRYCPLLWAGDQSVDFSRHDGLQTVICAALSAGLMGNCYHHSDIGGYTSLFGNIRTPELFMRWAEMAAFTPVMRTHEGNRPDENFQFWQADNVLAHFAKFTRIYAALAPYSRRLGEQAMTLGLPLQRPLFLHHEADPATYAIQDQYLYGEHILVAPVHAALCTDWEPYVPLSPSGAGWIHLWSRKEYPGGARVTVAAPLGEPPIFIRADAPDLDALLALAFC